MHTFYSTARNSYPIFSLSESGNFTKPFSKIPALDAAFGDSQDHLLTYCQCYTPFVKGLDTRLSYLFGKACVSQSPNFAKMRYEPNIPCMRCWRWSTQQCHCLPGLRW